jgi:hypothetical protein
MYLKFVNVETIVPITEFYQGRAAAPMNHMGDRQRPAFGHVQVFGSPAPSQFTGRSAVKQVECDFAQTVLTQWTFSCPKWISNAGQRVRMNMRWNGDVPRGWPDATCYWPSYEFTIPYAAAG